jgi:hypothetical protein
LKLLRAQVCAILFLCASLPLAAANRVFVSGTGMDTGACPITAPCRSFSYALTQVAANGEVIALDTAGYGTAVISQGVTIVAAPGATAFVAASSGSAISVNAGTNDVVTLRGLALTSTGALNGVDFSNGGVSLNVENCIINGFTAMGIRFIRNSDNSKPQLQVINSMIRNNYTGIYADDIGAGIAGPPPNICYVTIAGSFLNGNTNTGLIAADNSRIAVSDTLFAANSNGGIQAFASADNSYSEVNLDRCTVSRNYVGVQAGDFSGSIILHARVRLANCMITGNDTGVTTSANGMTLSRISNSVYTNTIEGNGVDGTPSSSYNAK